MGHSQMLKIRRTKQRTRKQLAGIAKRAKKLSKQNVTATSTGVVEKSSP